MSNHRDLTWEPRMDTSVPDFGQPDHIADSQNDDDIYEPALTRPIPGDIIEQKPGWGRARVAGIRVGGGVDLVWLDNGRGADSLDIGAFDIVPNEALEYAWRVLKRDKKHDNPSDYVKITDEMAGIGVKVEENVSESAQNKDYRSILSLASERLGIKDGEYGLVENTFPLIAKLWSDYLGIDLTPDDVPAMMILLKVARHRGGHGKRDNWTDIAGYAHAGDVLLEAK